MGEEYKYSELTGQIIDDFYRVYRNLGYGFLEKVYENALARELMESGLLVQQQAPIEVYYRDQIVGEYFADLLVEQLIIVELKAIRKLKEENQAQLLNYLKATPYEVGLLLNFGPKAKVIRKIYDNELKGTLSWHSKASDI